MIYWEFLYSILHHLSQMVKLTNIVNVRGGIIAENTCSLPIDRHETGSVLTWHAVRQLWSGACSTAHRSNMPAHWDDLFQIDQLLDNFHPYPVEQNGSDCRQVINYVEYRLPAIAAILFYWIRMKVVQQLTCLASGRPSGPAYSTGELLNTPLMMWRGDVHVWSCPLVATVGSTWPTWSQSHQLRGWPLTCITVHSHQFLCIRWRH